MSSNKITRWTESPANTSIIGYTETEVLEPESIYPGWMNLVAQRSIRAIAIGPKSRHIWMVTWGGVLSWRQREENTYYRYSSEHGLTGNGASCICVDEAERPWVGNAGGGLSYFEGDRWHAYPERETEVFRVLAGADSGPGIWAATDTCVYRISGPGRGSVPFLVNQPATEFPLTLLSVGNDLLLGNNRGLFRLRTGADPAPVGPDIIESCTSLARDFSGRIWIATAAEIYRMEEQLNPRPFCEGRAGRIRQIVAAKDRVWILATERLSVIDGEVWGPVPLVPGQPPLSALQTMAVSSSDNHLWLGTNSLLTSLAYTKDGSVLWDQSLLPLHPEDELNNLGRCVAGSESETQTIWIGTAGGLVTYEPDETWSIDQSKCDVRDLCITSTVGGEILWLLHWPRGFSSSAGPFQQPPGLPIALAKGQDDGVYGLTTRGLWLLGPRSQQIAVALPARALNLAQSHEGTWWAGTAEGVYACTHGIWAPATDQPGPGLSEIYALLTIGRGLWAASAAGLWRRSGGLWQSHNEEQATLVRALAPAASAGKLWLAQQDRLVRYDAANHTIDRSYSLAAHGLASYRIAALAEIRDDLWVVTAAGTTRIRLRDAVEK